MNFALADLAQDCRIALIMEGGEAPIRVLTDEKYHSDVTIGSYVVALLLLMSGHVARDWDE